MRLASNRFLTYCTNIHPADGWAAVRASLEQYAPSLKRALAPDDPFSIGLRLSGTESREVLEGDRLVQFKEFLDDQGLVVCTLNGFPYGPFHKQVVKDQVHAPDWRDPERVQYTLRLIELLAYLLPEGVDGGISTNPLSYRHWFRDGVDEATWTRMTRHVVEVVKALVRVRRERGRFIHLDVEPEPDGLLENSRELVRFFDDWLLPVGAPMLAGALGVTRSEAEALLTDHVQVCWDTCHVAVAYEDAGEVLRRYSERGIRVGRLQISSALRVPLPEAVSERTRLAGALQPFAESTYLHQVVQRNRDGTLRSFPDLDVALPAITDEAAEEWRIHFHVPVFLDRYGDFYATQAAIREALELLDRRPFTSHLEIETYTWDVLPGHLKLPLEASIRREFEWVLGILTPRTSHA